MSRSTVILTIGGNNPHIDKDVFYDICENFIFIKKDKINEHGRRGSITFNQLVDISRSNKFSYPLFFASKDRVANLISTYNSKLYGKISESKVLTMGTRDKEFDVRGIRWIVADIAEKQKIYKQFGSTRNLQEEQIVKFLKNSTYSIAEQAKYIVSKIDISLDYLRGLSSKHKALKYLEGKLSENQIHVYREAKGVMPQNLPTDFLISGVYIRDNYNPVIFIGNELSLYPEEGVGRKIYTLIFLLVSLFKDYSFAVQINHESPHMDRQTKGKLSDIYEITNEILMPEGYLRGLTFDDIDDIKEMSGVLKVSPTALTVRLSLLGILDKTASESIKKQLVEEYRAYVSKLKAIDRERRNAGKSTGPPLRNLCKSYHGDFIDFVGRNIPENLRRDVFSRRISYGRSYVKYEDLYG